MDRSFIERLSLLTTIVSSQRSLSESPKIHVSAGDTTCGKIETSVSSWGQNIWKPCPLADAIGQSLPLVMPYSGVVTIFVPGKACINSTQTKNDMIIQKLKDPFLSLVSLDWLTKVILACCYCWQLETLFVTRHYWQQIILWSRDNDGLLGNQKKGGRWQKREELPKWTWRELICMSVCSSL